jgi:hypothetical protein
LTKDQEAQRVQIERVEGLHQVSATPLEPLANVVFVHGLGGSGYSTWHSAGELGFWPRTLAADHPRACVWALHYQASVLDTPLTRAPTMDLLDRAAWLLEELVQNDVPARPIVFVAHSLGGLLVKQALQFSSVLGPQRWRPVWAQTRAVFFVATPHVGAQIANAAITLANALRGTHPLGRFACWPSRALKNLEKNNPTLRYLTDWYKDHAPVQGVETRAFSERKPVGGLMVVDETCASPQVAGCVASPLGDDHFTICKPSGKTHQVYRGVSEYVSDLEESIVSGSGRLRRGGDFVELVRGPWWERITRKGDPTAISFCEIGFNDGLRQPSITGKGFDEDGDPSAEWHSILGSFAEDEKRDLVLRYHWVGEIFLANGKAKNPEYHGFGQVTFSQPANPLAQIREGVGFYWNVNESHPEKTNYKVIELKRIADAAVVRIMKDGKRHEKAALTAAVLEKWGTL